MEIKEVIIPQTVLMDAHEGQIVHRDLGEELLFYRAVAGGAIEHVQENCRMGSFENPEGMGILSNDPVRNLKYHFVVSIALIARYCVEGGMPLDESFGLSDSYIQMMDRKQNLADVVLLHDKMVLDYTCRMRELKKQAGKTKQVTSALDYIYNHAFERITVEDIAEEVCISPTYLSRIFKQEVGVSVSSFVRQRKIEIAKSLLCFSDYTISDIAHRLSFSSQSHFTQQFHSAVGMTPKAYRDKYFGVSLGVNRDHAEETTT